MARYALIVGITEYQTFPPLSRPATDAAAIAALLETHGGYRVTMLRGQVTCQQLKAAFKDFLQEQAANHEALIYFTGHGFIVDDGFGEPSGCLATTDCRVETDGNQEITGHQRGIEFSQLNSLISRATLSSLVVLLDTCHSGKLIEKTLIEQNLSVFSGRKSPDYCLIAACRPHQNAYATQGADHSVFSGALLTGLGRDNAREDGIVTTTRLLSHVETVVARARQEVWKWDGGRSLAIVNYQPMPVTVETDQDVCPYQGLNAFTPETRQFFFGRRAEIEELVGRLAKANFVPVIGASGSGKSSVVRAGLMPWGEQQGWQVLGPIKPGVEPLAELKRCFRELFSNREIGQIYGLIEAEGLVALLDRLPSDQRYLLVVDQFEEVFTVCIDRAEQQQFIRCLTGISQIPASPLKIVTTMRSDFVTPWLSSDQLTRVIQNDAVWLGTLQGEPLTEAIVKPAEKQGYRFETGLLDLIQDDVASEENCLPLLEFALSQLWQHRDAERKRLTIAAYRAMGRLKGALNQRAEEIYHQAFKTEQERDWCRRVCLELVRIGQDGTADTRHRQTRQNVLAKGQTEKDQELINAVIETLVEGRLLVADKDDIDIAHEALMNGWERFQDWREEDRDRLRLIQRLKDNYAEWEDKQRDDNYLLQKGLLAELREQWPALKGDGMAAGLQDFFSLSDTKEKADVAVLEKALAEAQLREERTKILSLPPVKAVDKTVLAIKAVGDSLEKLQGQVINPVQDALHQAWSKICERLKLEGHTSLVNAVAFSPSGDRIVSGSWDNTLRLWDLEGRQIGAPFEGHTYSVNAVAFSPSGDRIVSGSRDNTLRLWDLEGRQIGAPFEGHTNWVNAVAFSPSGDRIVSGSDDHTLRLWDLEGRQIGAPFEGHTDSVTAVAFSPSGDRIVSGSVDNTLRLWDLEGRQIGAPFEGHTGYVTAVAFSPSGDRIVSGSHDHTLRLWDLEGRQIGAPFEGHTGYVTAVAFSPSGDRIVSGSRDNTLRLWDLEGRQIGAPFEGHTNWVNAVAFSPSGDRIVSGSVDNTLRLWPGGSWQDWLKTCCERLLRHSRFVQPVTAEDQQACQLCQQQVWTQAEMAQFWVAQGNALAFEGKLDAAIDKFQQAKSLDAELILDSQTEAQRLKAVGLLNQAHSQAKDGELEKALETFQAVQALDPTLDFDPQERVNQLRAIGLLTEGFSAASGGVLRNNPNPQKAIEKFQEAQTFDESYTFDPHDRAYQLATPAMLDQSRELARQGKIEAALALLRELAEHRPTFEIPAHVLSFVARQGCTQGFKELSPTLQAEIGQAAAQAVAQAPEDGRYRDTRGLYRALQGEIDGAIEDFQAFIDWVASQEEAGEKLQAQVQERQAWIAALQAGDDPFTPDVLATIRRQ